MSLLDLKTDLKSLKYGQDQPGGGNSGLPYITTDINTVDTPTPLIRADFPTFFGGSLPINVDINLNQLRLTKFDDKLVRGGIIGALNASVVDTLRIGKFFLDAPKGPLFIAKQVGLQLSNPRLEIPKNPLNIAAGSPSNALSVGTNGLLQPTRIYNLGVNTLLQVPLNAFGGHIIRHGLFPIQSDASKYEAIVTANNDNLGLFSNNPSENNRLVLLKNKFQLGDRQTNATINRNFLNQINTVLSAASAFLGGPSIPPLNINKTETVIDDYAGGPSSVYGIGRTLIKRTSNTEDGIKINLLSQFSRYYAGKTRDDKGSPQSIILKSTFDYGLSNRKQSTLASRSFTDLPDQISTPSASLFNNIASDKDKQHARDNNLPKLENKNDLVVNGPSNHPDSQEVTGLKSLSLPNLIYSSGISSSYSDVKVATDNLIASSSNGFGIYSVITDTGSLSAPNGILPVSTASPTYKNGYGDVVTISGSWNRVTRELRVGSGRKDKINLTPIFDGVSYFGEDTSPGSNKTDNVRDLVKFRIQAVNTNNPDNGRWMVFRAYLTDLSDDTSAEWTDVKYAGRGDKFHIYTGFTRKIGISFKVAALSVDEMQFIYQKLNFLMSNTMPDYSNELMRGPLIRMTVGNYIDSQLGILTQVSIKPDKESPWEIAIEDKLLILPHVLDVTLGFTPIGSETAGSNLIAKKSETTSHIAQNNTKDIKNLQYIK